MTSVSGAAVCGADRAIRYCWLLILFLVPFLVGGVVVGDEALLLKLARELHDTSVSFQAFARSSNGWYIPHHLLWFLLLYATQSSTAALHLGSLSSELVISSESVIAALSGIALCFTFLVRVMRLGATLSVWVILAFFAAGYGVFAFCMAGTVESYMMLVMAARLFLAEREIHDEHAWKLAMLDILLVALKPYSLLFLVCVFPLLRFNGSGRRIYLAMCGVLFVLFAVARLWIWNPPAAYTSAFAVFSPAVYFSRLLEQFFSPWTGLLFCLPVFLVLFWLEPERRRSLAFKLLGLTVCLGFFAFYGFFNGDVAGGRYIFPFCVAFLPEIAGAARNLLGRFPAVALSLPLLVLLFCPLALFSLPFFPGGAFSGSGACTPPHPAVAAWSVTLAKLSGKAEIEVCYHDELYVMTPRDAASPRLGPWRLAYLLQGGHSPAYRQVAHDDIQGRHDVWATRLVLWLHRVGLGNPLIWESLGLVPAIIALWLAVWSALRISEIPVTWGSRHDASI